MKWYKVFILFPDLTSCKRRLFFTGMDKLILPVNTETMEYGTRVKTYYYLASQAEIDAYLNGRRRMFPVTV